MYQLQTPTTLKTPLTLIRLHTSLTIVEEEATMVVLDMAKAEDVLLEVVGFINKHLPPIPHLKESLQLVPIVRFSAGLGTMHSSATAALIYLTREQTCLLPWLHFMSLMILLHKTSLTMKLCGTQTQKHLLML